MASTNYEYQKIRYMTIEQMQKSTNEELINYINIAAKYANKRRDNVIKYYSDNPNAVTSQSYRDYEKPKKASKSMQKAKEGDFLGWATYNFNLPKNTNLSTIPNLKGYLISKLKKTQQFLRNKTSTVYGMKKSLDKFEERLKYQGANIDVILNVKSDDEKYKMLWRIYNDIADEYNPNISSNLSSNELQLLITEQIYKNTSENNIKSNIKKAENKHYEDTEKKERNKKSPVSRFTSFDEEDDDGNTFSKL